MTGRSRVQSLAASPTMVGAITTLIIIVAVFLAYNANNGLPFVPVYRVSAEIPNAARLAPNNEVRIGGNRVGVVESIEVTDNDTNGDKAAQINMKLDKSAQPLPEDTTVRVRYRSSFGLKYLELQRGDGPALPEGATLPLAQAIEQTEFDDIGNTFDTDTRENSRVVLEGFGSGFAGRGASLNQAIEALDPLFTNLQPVSKVLVASPTRLERFFPELGDAARIVAPVAVAQAELFTNMAITFTAISSDPDAIREGISEGVPTLAVGIRSLRNQRPFLAKFAVVARELRPGVRDLRISLPTLNDAFRIGTRTLRRTPPMNRQLGLVFGELEQLVDTPQTKITLTRLTDTFDQVRPLADHVVPYQTVCNYWNYDWTVLAEQLSARDQIGYSHRQTLINMPGTLTPGGRPEGPLGAYSGIQANGRRIRNGTPPFTVPPFPGPPGPGGGIFQPFGIHNANPVANQPDQPVLNGDPYNPVVTPSGAANCTPGQTGYLLGDNSETSADPSVRNPGQVKRNPTVNNIPGVRGPTFLGRAQRP